MLSLGTAPEVRLATLVKTDLGKWKAVIRKTGWPSVAKTFRTKRDAEDWARRAEDEMVRGAYIQRAPADRLTVADALKRYLAEVTPTKHPSIPKVERLRCTPYFRSSGSQEFVSVPCRRGAHWNKRNGERNMQGKA